MESVFAFLLFWLVVAVVVIVKAVAIALTLYLVILGVAWLWDTAREKTNRRGKHYR